MTNNTIHNVPRELLEELRDAANESMNATTRQHQIDYFAGLIAKADALLSAPSPAGGGGLEVVAWRIGFPNNAGYKVYEQRQPWAYEQYGVPSVIVYEVQELCRLSAAHAIIDGMRGEVERLGSQKAEWVERATALGQKADQQAQRIGELEGLLRAESARVDFLDAYIVTADAPDTGKAAMLADSGTLRECIDAALSAGKGGER